MLLQVQWSVIGIFVTILMVYYNCDNVKVRMNYNNSAGKVLVKKIVAYSFRKQLELEDEQYINCEKNETLNISQIVLNRKFWFSVEDFFVNLVTLDNRLDPYKYLRILAVIKGDWRNKTTYCQMLIKDGSVRILKSTIAPIWYEKWDTNDNNTYYHPVLVSCRLEIGLNPLAVTLTKTPCQLSIDKFIGLDEKSQNDVSFTVCVKPLKFPRENIAERLAHWIEISRVLGADFFHIFLGDVTDRTKKLLKWYQRKFPHTFLIEEFHEVDDTICKNCTFFQNTWQRRRYEIISYNRCLYRNLHSKFIVPLDIDEIIVPKSNKSSWTDLVHNLDDYASLIVQNVYYFFRKTHGKMPVFFTETTRTKAPSLKGENGKSFVATKNALTVFNHYALHVLRPDAIKHYFLPFADAQLNHYKDSCDHAIFPQCTVYLSSPTVVDDVIFKYKREFYNRYNDIVSNLMPVS
ncbi:hypothetical protein ABEB36_014088 [Hypothenemus hampei]|uniref:Glycosyltransferase family 92 protein n=1 Tax=Hypothenemus hampei TaxID=57062 RepID=A0ABD1E7V0_HYPHA